MLAALAIAAALAGDATLTPQRCIADARKTAEARRKAWRSATSDADDVKALARALADVHFDEDKPFAANSCLEATLAPGSRNVVEEMFKECVAAGKVDELIATVKRINHEAHGALAARKPDATQDELLALVHLVDNRYGAESNLYAALDQCIEVSRYTTMDECLVDSRRRLAAAREALRAFEATQDDDTGDALAKAIEGSANATSCFFRQPSCPEEKKTLAGPVLEALKSIKTMAAKRPLALDDFVGAIRGYLDAAEQVTNSFAACAK